MESEELLKLRIFAVEFRAWKHEMNNIAFRRLLAALAEVDAVQKIQGPMVASEFGEAVLKAVDEARRRGRLGPGCVGGACGAD